MTLTIDTTSYRSRNYSARPDGAVIDALVLHTGGGTRSSDLGWLCNPRSVVSAHYYVCRDGTVYQLVNESDMAWHAGVSSYLGRTNYNDFSIGIETEHAEGQDWPAVQREALRQLCRLLIARYGILQPYVVAHRWIATPPGRKPDPVDWDDQALGAWIALLYAPEPTPYPYDRTYRVKAGVVAVVRTDYRTTAPIVTKLAAGTEIGCDSLNFGERVRGDDSWLHLRSGLGFVHISALEVV